MLFSAFPINHRESLLFNILALILQLIRNDFEYYNKISKELESLVRKNAGENLTSIPMVV